MTKEILMLGNEAIARGAYEAGVKLSAAYPGTPSTEISENIMQYDGIYAEWSPNEKVALEVAIGASFSGVRSLASMKHVGLNVASDPLYSAAYTGVNGGLVIVVADDPGIYSSQNEQDTRMIARASHIPLLEPSDSQEAKEYMKFAYEISEKYDTPVILRTTTRLSHSRSRVSLDEPVLIEDKIYQKSINKNVMMPGFANERHRIIEERNQKLSEDGAGFFINKIEYQSRDIGIITSGISYQYVKEAMPHASVLKLGLINPLPRKLIEEFAAEVKELYIFEELEPVIEEQVKSWGLHAAGKELFSEIGEYSANILREVLNNQPVLAGKREGIPKRPPILCPGCPHRSVYTVLKKIGVHACGDIGCYTLGALAPLSVIDTTICMGASISMLHGMEKAKGKEFIKNWVAVIGDSTFMHTGINSLMNMVYNKASGTVLILDNSTTGMTGQQGHAGTGATLQNGKTKAVDIKEVCTAVGVGCVAEINAYQIEELEKQIIQTFDRDEVSVIIIKSPCVMLKKEPKEMSYKINTSACKGCGKCMKTGCPAIVKEGSNKPYIDETKCSQCGLCHALCSFCAVGQTKI